MITYVGANNIISPLGFTTVKNLEALAQGEVAVKKQQFHFSESVFCCSKIEDATLNNYFSAISNITTYTHLEKMCILSIQDVVQQSGIDLKNKKNLLIISTTKGNIDVLEGVYKNIDSNRAYLPVFAKTVGNYFGCASTPLIISNACISGLLAIIAGKRLIENGNYKNIIVCGADIVSEFTLSGFKSFNALSDEPSKPFDKNRIGINLGEAASSILLSSDEISSIKISAGNSANDANHISGPSRNGDGLFHAVTKTLEDSKTETVDFISAHGTATEFNDEMESVAFSRAKLDQVPLNSLKGYYGHTLGAAGVLEGVIAINSLASNTLIKSMGFELQGTTHELNVIKKTEQKRINSCLKTASGFGGCNAAALFEKV
ncbi:MAG: beta-ketoacyl synthase N-terminal-like domain-containing protein [Bacteroidota bacterium]|nr:beta-ketoacyl synthase N-terminal-like domain-containing protein [Bacteroidota bacterium]